MSLQQEPNAILAALKVVVLVFVLGALAGIGYWYLASKAPRQTTESGSTWPYINQTLGLRMDLPNGWQITESQENGMSSEELTYDENGEAILDCRTHIQLAANDYAFLVADDNGDCQTPGRGGYWGDLADGITSPETLENLCNEKQEATSCELKTNANGLRYVQVHYAVLDSWGQQLTNIDEFYFFHEGGVWDGIVLSDESFVQAGLADPDAELQQIAESLEFWPK